MLVDVIVTDKDIKKGRMNNCVECPVALALHRVITILSVVYTHKISILDSGQVVLTRSLPREVSEKIKQFDAGIRIEPFSFQLDIPKYYIR